MLSRGKVNTRFLVKSQGFIILLGFSTGGCSYFSGGKSDQTPTHPFRQTSAAEVSTTPHFNHGYNGEVPAFNLVDQLALEHNKDELIEQFDVSSDEIEKWRTDPPSLIYSGEMLSLKNCDSTVDTSGARHLAELWTQPYLLSLYSHPSVDWFTQALKSMQEVDSIGAFRPRSAMHPDIIKRLGNGTDSARWALNAIRFRISDRGTVDIGSDSGISSQQAADQQNKKPGVIKVEDLPANEVLAQIKLNYELDIYGSTADTTINFFAAIHSIAIRPEYVNEFIVDVLRIEQNPQRCGCDILKILNKYVRNVGLPEDAGPRSGYFFMHTNALDKKADVDEWRFAEFKPVSNDYIDFAKRPEMEAQVKEDLVNAWMNSRIQSLDFSNGVEDKDFDKIDFQGIAGLIEKITVSGNRHIFGPHETPAGTSDLLRALRIVPMSFPVFVAPNPNSDKIQLATNVAPVDLWFSGTVIDEGRNAVDKNKRINLLVDLEGKEVAIQHPGRRHEQTWTCAQCHARQVSNRLQTAPGPQGALLDIIPFMNFRHIGFGDGGVKECNPMFGAPREQFTARISEYLMEAANGAKLYNAMIDYQKRSELAIPVANNTRTGGIDYFRCQGARFNFVDQGNN